MQIADRILITYRVPTAEFDAGAPDFATGAATYPISPTTVEVREVVEYMGANTVIDNDKNEVDLGEIIEGDHFFSLEVVQ